MAVSTPGKSSLPAGSGAGAMLRLIRDGRASTRAELVELTGLARSTVDSVRRVSPLSDWKTSWSRLLSASNIEGRTRRGPRPTAQTLILLELQEIGQRKRERGGSSVRPT